MSCLRRRLAASDQCVVESCECGAIHVTVGALTMRLAPGALLDIAETLGMAARVLDARRAAADLGTGLWRKQRPSS